ncbi:MAG: hypothetical protein JO364_05935 [Pseudonocardiales bacterium]|nr:hypothetical protein [Pseudonocardiales bacterium]
MSRRICCFLTMRLLVTWLTVDSTNAVEMASPAVVGDPGSVGAQVAVELTHRLERKLFPSSLRSAATLPRVSASGSF